MHIQLSRNIWQQFFLSFVLSQFQQPLRIILQQKHLYRYHCHLINKFRLDILTADKEEFPLRFRQQQVFDINVQHLRMMVLIDSLEDHDQYDMNERVNRYNKHPQNRKPSSKIRSLCLYSFQFLFLPKYQLEYQVISLLKLLVPPSVQSLQQSPSEKHLHRSRIQFVLGNIIDKLRNELRSRYLLLLPSSYILHYHFHQRDYPL